MMGFQAQSKSKKLGLLSRPTFQAESQKYGYNNQGIDPVLFHDLVNIPYLMAVEKFGICCFTARCDNSLMWAHYANDHKGRCVKYNFTCREAFFLLFSFFEIAA